jgi:hypothetical protein
MLRHVQRGEPLRIPADDWNKIVDATRAFYERQGGRGGGPSGASGISGGGGVLVRNDSGADVPRFGVLGIDGPIVSPDDHADAFAQQVALKGVTPTLVAHAGRFVIAQAPIAAGAIGRAAISGVTIARVIMTSGTETRADVDNGQTGQLRSGSGLVQILWTAGGTGTVDAIVRIGSGSALLRLVVTAVRNDYLVCRAWDGTNLGSTYYVAKPFELRQTPFNGLVDQLGLTVTASGVSARTVTNSAGLVEHQEIVPPYRTTISAGGVGRTEFYAWEVSGTGVFTSEGLPAGSPERELTLIDPNMDGRAWAMVPQ